MHLGIKMQRQIAQLGPDARDQSLDLGLLPAQNAREERVQVRRDRLEHVGLVIQAELFELGVFGPRALGELLR